MKYFAKERLIKSVFLALIFCVFATFIPNTNAASLTDLLKKQTDLKAQADKNKKMLDQKKAEATNLQGAISNLDSTISSTQSQITDTQNQIKIADEIITELNLQITNAQTSLNSLDEKLKLAYVSLYELSQTNSLELIITSSSMTELASHTQYIQSIQEDLQNDINEFNLLKNDLNAKKTDREAQKADLESLNKSLAATKNSLNSQKNQKNYLLQVTQGEQVKYEDILKKLTSQQENIGKEIYEARRKLTNGQTILGGTGGYPWAGEPNSYAVDPWFFYKRQCTSYVAWKFQAVYGRAFNNTRPGQGSAWNWPALARDQGYQTSSSPSANAIVSWGKGTNMPYGHVAWVESVNGNGTINVSEFNWGWERNYSERKNIDPYRYGTPTYIYP